MRWAMLLALMPLAAGCLQPDARPVSSEDGRDLADVVARRWDPDAELVGLAALDPGPGAMGQVREDLGEAEQDLDDGREQGTLSAQEESELEGEVAVLRAVVQAGPSRPGDGRAAVWLHSYRNATGAGYAVTVGSADVVDAREVDLDEDDGEDDGPLDFGSDAPLGSWRLDSVAAADAARDAHDAYRELEGDDNVTAFAALVREAGEGEEDGAAALWILVLEANDGRNGVFLLVNADNGTVIDVFGLLGGLLLGRESGSEGGQFVAGVDATASAAFTLGRPHARLAIGLNVRPPPPQPIEATVTAPDGTTRSWSVDLRPGTDAYEAVVLDDVAAGDYRVDLAAPLAPYAQWTVSWCTDGGGGLGAFFFPPAACDDVPDQESAQRPS